MTKGKGFDLKQDVLDELEWDPQIDASRIGVSVEGGVLTLTGHVRSYDGTLPFQRTKYLAFHRAHPARFNRA